MMNISPMLQGYIENCSSVSSPSNNMLVNQGMNFQMPVINNQPQDNDNAKNDEFVSKTKKTKTKLALAATLITAVGVSAYAIKRGKKLNGILGESDDLLSNLKAGFKSFTKKGREYYDQTIKHAKSQFADTFDDHLVPRNHCPYPPKSSAEEVTTALVPTNRKTPEIDHDVLLTRKSNAPQNGILDPAHTRQLAIIDRMEQSKRNRISVIRSLFDDESVSFYQDRPMTLYSRIHSNLYDEIRTQGAKYGIRETCNREIAELTRKPTEQIRVLEENGWHFRKPMKHVSAPTLDRISLNVYPEDDLISKLDGFIAKHDGLVSYKTPECLSDWSTRHDPITIYFKKPLTQEIEEEVVKIASPHIRHTEGEVLIGRKIANSIYEVKEPDERAVRELITRAKNLDFDSGLVAFLENPDQSFGARLYERRPDGTLYVNSSAGLFEAAKRLVDIAESSLLRCG